MTQKTKAIVTFLILWTLTLAGAYTLLHLEFGVVEIEYLVIAMAILTPLMGIGSYAGFMNKEKIKHNRNKWNTFFMVLGMLMMFFALLQLLMVSNSDLGIYLNLFVGVCFFFMGRRGTMVK